MPAAERESWHTQTTRRVMGEERAASLNPNQFSQYRGIPLGVDKHIEHSRHFPEGSREAGVDIHDDAHVLSKIRGRNPADFDPPYNEPSHMQRFPLYGQHWTDDPETARQFATQQGSNMGRHRGGLSNVRHPYNAVVIEAKTNVEPERISTGKAGDNEVRPARRDLGEIEKVVAHIHRFEPIPEGTGLTEANKVRHGTYVRSLTIPPEHWRNA